MKGKRRLKYFRHSNIQRGKRNLIKETKRKVFFEKFGEDTVTNKIREIVIKI
jgi:hypothetical protein